nr:hypothetical protein [Streptomyces hygroscopicus]
MWSPIASACAGCARPDTSSRIAHLRQECPPVLDLAHNAAPGTLYAIFQLLTALLLLSAASSSFQVGPGLLKALARHHGHGGTDAGILPAVWGRTNCTTPRTGACCSSWPSPRS